MGFDLIVPDALELFIPEEIDFAVGGDIKLIAKGKQRTAGFNPIARTFLAAAVCGQPGVIVVDLRKHFSDACFQLAAAGRYGQKHGKDIGKDPGIPVVDPSAPISHPAEIVAGQVRRYDPAIQLIFYACQQGRTESLQSIMQNMIGDRKQLCGLGIKQIDVGIVSSRQKGMGLANIMCVGGKPPEGLLADGKNAVADIRQETTLVFGNFSQHQCQQSIPPGKVRCLLGKTVPGLMEGHKLGGADHRPRIAEKSFCFANVDGVCNRLPKSSVCGRWEQPGGKIHICQRVLLQPGLKHNTTPYMRVISHSL